MSATAANRIRAMAARAARVRVQIGAELDVASDPCDLMGRAFVDLRVAEDALSDAAAIIGGDLTAHPCAMAGRMDRD